MKKLLGYKLYDSRYTKNGYTLMEMVVAIAIFVILSVAITGVFIAILRVQRKTAAMQAVQQDARWAMETMARYARMKKINYCGIPPCHCSSPCSCPADSVVGFDGVEKLYLEDGFGFKKEGSKLEMTTDGGATWNDITPAKVEVLDLKFYIAPKPVTVGSQCYSPYEVKGPDQQSRVTIFMETQMAGAPAGQEMVLQTTVSTRAYTR